jgi:RNA polymerase sigma-70 factor, ECF subfamily
LIRDRWVRIAAMPQPGSDRVDFERLMRESYRLVYQIAYSVLGNAADAEEVTQDTFLAAYQKIGRLRDPERFRPWVARAGWRLALNRRRGTTRAMGRDGAWMVDRPASENPEAGAAEREFETRVRAQVDLLPEKLRAVVLLIGVEEMDVRTVAGILKIPEGTVRSRLYLARRQLLREVMR